MRQMSHVGFAATVGIYILQYSKAIIIVTLHGVLIASRFSAATPNVLASIACFT